MSAVAAPHGLCLCTVCFQAALASARVESNYLASYFHAAYWSIAAVVKSQASWCHAAYGSNATVAKTEEELEDRHTALFGDYDNADDIKVDLPNGNGNAYEDRANGDAGTGTIGTAQNSAAQSSNGNAQIQNGFCTDSSHPLRVCPASSSSSSCAFLFFSCWICILYAFHISMKVRMRAMWTRHSNA